MYQSESFLIGTGSISDDKSEYLARLLGHANLVCFNGWIDGFKEHRSIVFYKSEIRKWILQEYEV